MSVNRRGPAAALIVAVAALGVGIGVWSGCGSGGGAPQFEVSVQFAGEATQDDIDEVGAFLRTFDDLDFLILEIFPPIGRAVVTTEAADFCQTAKAELEARSYVDEVSCGPRTETGGAEPDQPVGSDEGAARR